MSGSFWMSCRYWSNAVDGDDRKYPFDDLVSVTCSIHAPSRFKPVSGASVRPLARRVAGAAVRRVTAAARHVTSLAGTRRIMLALEGVNRHFGSRSSVIRTNQ